MPLKLSKLRKFKLTWLLAAQTVLWLLVFSIPLVFAWFMRGDNVFELEKSAWFDIGTLVFSFLVIGRLLFEGFDRKQWLTRSAWLKYWLIPAIFMGFWLLSLIWSVDPTASFFGLNDRQMGVKNMLFGGLFFAAAVFHLSAISASWRRQLVAAIIISANISALYAVLQIVGIDIYSWSEPPLATGRSTSSFGQPNFLASFLVLVWPLAIYAAVTAKKFYARSFWIGSAVLQFLALLTTGSRSAWLAFALGVLIFIFFVLIFWRQKLIPVWRRYRLWLLAGGLLVLLAGGFLFMKNSSLSQRISSAADLNGGSVGIRLKFWKVSLEGVKEHPWLGYGPENQEQVITPRYEKDWSLFGQVNASSNRAHNFVIDLLLTGGIFGLIIALLWYASFFRLAYLCRRSPESAGLALALAFGLGMYLISLMFGFSVITTEMYVWFFLALLTVMAADYPASSAMPAIRPRLAGLLLLLLAILAAWQISFEANRLRCDIVFKNMRMALGSKDYIVAVQDYQQLVRLDVHDSYYAYYFADQLPLSASEVSNPALVTLLQTVGQSILSSYDSLNANKDYVTAKIEAFSGNTPAALAAFDRLIADVPNLPRAQFFKAKVLEDDNQLDKALGSFNAAEADLPPVSGAWPDLSTWQRATDYYRSLIQVERGDIRLLQKDYAGAEADYLAARQSYPQDTSLYKKLADTYYLRGDLQTAIRYNLDGFDRQPEASNWPLALAILYNQTGDRPQALHYIDLALKLDPNNPMIKNVNQELSNKK
jgi:putative inorganic carbon (HCO3(-)) transporter